MWYGKYYLDFRILDAEVGVSSPELTQPKVKENEMNKTKYYQFCSALKFRGAMPWIPYN